MNTEKILIAGAGPVGLAAALFLRAKDYDVQIFDPLLEPYQNSKALAINPRTLEMLADVGVTDDILKLGLPIHFAELWLDKKSQGKIDLGLLPKNSRFMIALSQGVTEGLLTQKLADLRVEIQRGWAVTAIEKNSNGVEIKIQNVKNNELKKLSGSYLLAADGAHSLIRELLNIPFNGSSFKDEWYLADVPLTTKLKEDGAYVELLRGGGFNFLIRVVKDKNAETQSPALWRIIGTSPDFLNSMKLGKVDGSPVWESHFKISHRLNRELSKGRVFFMGDAAHIHSPIGARGMNLGVEDAWTFSHLLATGQVDQYSSERRKVDGAVVRKVALLSRVIMGRSPVTRTLRKLMVQALKIRPLQNVIVKTISGLDHPLIH